MRHLDHATSMDRRTAIGLAIAGSATLPAMAVAAGSSDAGAGRAKHGGETVTTPISAVVRTGSGQIRGYVRQDIFTFKGIPYGDDTSGANRWRAPKPPQPWSGVRSCLHYGPVCPQGKRRGWGSDESAFLMQWDDGYPGEDCLRVNVWTPAINDGKARPVLFWIHGGGFTDGSSQELPSYHGENIARRGDVVFVSVNHRLGPLGFLNLAGRIPGFEDSPVVGLLDLVQALEWVRDNIASFGGDPRNVTILGQSGGGAKVAALMTMPRANGLFHKAASFSAPILVLPTPAVSAEMTDAVSKVFGGIDERRLQAMPIAEFVTQALAAAAALPVRPSWGTTTGLRPPPWGPVANNVHLPEYPFSAHAPSLSAHVPLLVGATRDETAGMTGPMSEGDLRRAVAQFWPDKMDSVIKAAREFFPAATPAVLRRAIFAYSMRSIGTNQLDLQYAAGGRKLFNYWFMWDTPQLEHKPGAFHCQDLNFWFDNVARAENATSNNAESRALATIMADAVIAFARTGDPSTQQLTWPTYTPDRKATMVLDVRSRVVYNPAGDLHALIATK